MNTIASVVIALLTILASGVSSSVITYRLNRNKEQTFFMRKKAEELYLATDEFGRNFGTSMIPVLAVASGELDWNQMRDMQIANPPKRDYGGAETMEMLTKIYFSAAEPDLKKLFAARDELNGVQSAFKEAYQQGDHGDTRWRKILAGAAMEVERAVQALKAKVVTLSGEHIH